MVKSNLINMVGGTGQFGEGFNWMYDTDVNVTIPDPDDVWDRDARVLLAWALNSAKHYGVPDIALGETHRKSGTSDYERLNAVREQVLQSPLEVNVIADYEDVIRRLYYDIGIAWGGLCLTWIL